MTRPTAVDPGLLQYATERQQKILQACIDAGSLRAGARSINCDFGYAGRILKVVERKAALSGYAPAFDMRHSVPSPFVVKGVSSYYDKDGALRGQWVKSKLDNERAEQAIREFVETLVKDAKGLSPRIPAPKHINADLLAVYPMGDPHFGMYAWAAEAGSDFDAAIAEAMTCAAIDRLVDCAPAAETALLIELGDFFHADDSKAVTPGHGNKLDVDTRWAKVLVIGLRAMKHGILRLLQKHRLVIVRINPGNHDPHSSYMLAVALAEFFCNNDRVKIDLSPAVHWYYRFGKVLIGTTHGDTTKAKDLPGVMAADRPQDWGLTEQRYWYCGHIHHVEVKEAPGVISEYFRTLAARDAWHSGQGYRAGRDMRLIVHHKDFGEIERHRCDVAMIEKGKK